MKKWIIPFYDSRKENGIDYITKGELHFAITDSMVIKSVNIYFEKVALALAETDTGQSYDKTARNCRDDFFSDSEISLNRIYGKNNGPNWKQLSANEINILEKYIKQNIIKPGKSYRIIETVLRGTKVSGTYQNPSADMFKTKYKGEYWAIGSCTRFLESKNLNYYSEDTWDNLDYVNTDDLFSYNIRVKELFEDYQRAYESGISTKSLWEKKWKTQFNHYPSRSEHLDKLIRKHRQIASDHYITGIDVIYNFFTKEDLKKYNEVAHIKPVSRIKYELEGMKTIDWDLLSEISDKNNTLLLPVNIHRLFDSGIISFDQSGKILFEEDNRKYIKKLEIENFVLDSKLLTDKRKQYIKYHYDNVYGKGI